MSTLAKLCKAIGLEGDRGIVSAGLCRDEDLGELLFDRACYRYAVAVGSTLGVPLLEARRCDCVVLCSDATSIPGVIGYRELLFDLYDVVAIQVVVSSCDDFYMFALIMHAAAKEKVLEKVAGSAVGRRSRKRAARCQAVTAARTAKGSLFAQTKEETSGTGWTE